MEDYIKIIDACEHNLKHVNVNIPKKKITVFTGVSGSGKSSLCMDTIAAESRRELNETFPSFVQQYLPKYGRPEVGVIENLPITMILDQKKPGNNSRSTIGTYTDIYAFLRLLFSRVGAPFVGYSDYFSFNHPKGWCEKCEGIGEVRELDIHKLVDFDKCLNDEGVINFPAFTTGAWRWKRYALSGLFDLDKKIKDYNKEELELFLYSPQVKLKSPPSNWPKSAKYEGIYPRMYRSIIYTKEGKRHAKILDQMVSSMPCPKCEGSRLNPKIRSCLINNMSIADVLNLQIPDLIAFVKTITDVTAVDIKRELIKRLEPLNEIGLGYLDLSRGMSSLSGGEAQRIKISKYINSALTDVVYVLDEPSVGLHHHDIHNLKSAILKLRDRGNTIMMVEHHKSIIEMADYIVDIGPGSGELGGEIVFCGSYKALLKSDSVTGKMLSYKTSFKESSRAYDSYLNIENVFHHNLKGLSVRFPKNALSVVAGVAGSGKSSLIDTLVKEYEGDLIHVNQKTIGANSRSTPATYIGISDYIRTQFSKANNVSASYFSFNSKGACPHCKGKGIITSEMGFMEKIETTCEVCGGKRYSEEVLKYRYKGYNIAEMFDLTVHQALGLFHDDIIKLQLNHLYKVGLGYLHLNQSLSTLSGGELQRMKLASQLADEKSIYVLDEPTDGLHISDVHHLMTFFNELVEYGHTLIIVDHHLDVIKNADYLIELGPSGGDKGGYLLYEGPPKGILNTKRSITRKYLTD